MKNLTRIFQFVLFLTIIVLPYKTIAEDGSGKLDISLSEEKVYLEKIQKFIPDMKNGRVQYEICALCHSPEGWGNMTGRFPQIAGQHFSVVVKQIEDIRNGNRDNPTMYPFAQFEGSKNYLQDVIDVASYISQLPMTANNSYGSGRHLAIGEELYKDNCVQCHGATGEGDAKKFYPRIHGQHYNYLLRQMRWIKRNKRRNANLYMKWQIEKFRDRDLRAIADYVSRLKPNAELMAEDNNQQNKDFNGYFNHAQKTRKRVRLR